MFWFNYFSEVAVTDCELTSSIERKQPHSYEIQQKAKNEPICRTGSKFSRRKRVIIGKLEGVQQHSTILCSSYCSS